MIQSLRHEIAGFVEVNPEGGKVSRAAAASPQLESGNWYLPHPILAPWVEAFIGECAAFPRGAHDDQVDAWSQGAKRLLLNRTRPLQPAVVVRPICEAATAHMDGVRRSRPAPGTRGNFGPAIHAGGSASREEGSTVNEIVVSRNCTVT